MIGHNRVYFHANRAAGPGEGNMSSRTREGMMPRRAYSYRRWSSPQQRRGRSAERQAEWSARVCKESGWLLDSADTYTDDGVGAFRGANSDTGALAAFLADVRAGLIPSGSVLLVESLDRLSREQVDEAFDLFRGLLKAGISIRTCVPDRFYDASAKFDMLTLLEFLFIAARAHEESATKSMRIADVWRARRERARESKAPRGGRIPWWLRREGGRFVLNERLAPVARDIVLLTGEGLGRKRLLAELRARYPDLSAGPAGGWRTTTVQRVLTSRAVVGEYQPRQRNADGVYQPVGDPIPGYFPPVVSEAELAAAKAGSRARARHSGRPAAGPLNLFTGLVWHADYRATCCLLTEGGHADGKRYRYLGVRAALVKDRAGVECPRWRYDQFESALVLAVEELQLADVLPPSALVDATARRLSELGERLLRLETRAATLQQLAESPDASEETASDAFASRQRVLADAREVAAQRARLMHASDAQGGDALARAQSIVDAWRGEARPAEKRALAERVRAALQRLVESIWVRPQRLSRQRTALHCQIYLRSGVRRPLLILPPGGADPRSLWDMSGCDFRAGNEADQRGPAAGA